MATATVTLAQKYGLVPFNEDRDFDSWKREVTLWQSITELAKNKQGPVLFLSLPEKVRAQCSSLTEDEMRADERRERGRTGQKGNT